MMGSLRFGTLGKVRFFTPSWVIMARHQVEISLLEEIISAQEVKTPK
jgi:hypothetical protein